MRLRQQAHQLVGLMCIGRQPQPPQRQHVHAVPLGQAAWIVVGGADGDGGSIGCAAHGDGSAAGSVSVAGIAGTAFGGVS
jgi:hypothetical protein